MAGCIGSNIWNLVHILKISINFGSLNILSSTCVRISLCIQSFGIAKINISHKVKPIKAITIVSYKFVALYQRKKWSITSIFSDNQQKKLGQTTVYDVPLLNRDHTQKKGWKTVDYDETWTQNTKRM